MYEPVQCMTAVSKRPCAWGGLRREHDPPTIVLVLASSATTVAGCRQQKKCHRDVQVQVGKNVTFCSSVSFTCRAAVTARAHRKQQAGWVGRQPSLLTASK